MTFNIEDYLKLAADLYEFDSEDSGPLKEVVEKYKDDELELEDLENVSAAADYKKFIKNLDKTK